MVKTDIPIPNEASLFLYFRALFHKDLMGLKAEIVQAGRSKYFAVRKPDGSGGWRWW